MGNSGYGEIGSFSSRVSSHLLGRFAFVVAKEAPALVNIAGLMGAAAQVKTCRPAELAGQTIGVMAGTSAKANALAFLNANSINASILEFLSSFELAEAMRTHAIAAIASERSRLLGYQATIPGSQLLEERFSPQPLVMALKEQQTRLRNAVNAIVKVPARAEELGLLDSDVSYLVAQSERGRSELNAINPQVREFLELGSSPDSSSSLGNAVDLATGFTRRVLSRLGNASQLWKRHFPKDQQQ
jgi:hypothetical protein